MSWPQRSLRVSAASIRNLRRISSEMRLATAGFITNGQIFRPELQEPFPGGAFTVSIFHSPLTYLATWCISRQTHLKVINKTTPNEMFDFVMLPRCWARHVRCLYTAHLYCFRAMLLPPPLSLDVTHLFVYQWSHLSTRHKKDFLVTL